jgi:hypothetical protein
MTEGTAGGEENIAGASFPQAGHEPFAMRESNQHQKKAIIADRLGYLQALPASVEIAFVLRVR